MYLGMFFMLDEIFVFRSAETSFTRYATLSVHTTGPITHIRLGERDGKGDYAVDWHPSS